MALKAFRRVGSGDRSLNSVQDSVEAALRPLIGNALLDGHVIGPFDFAQDEQTLVAHRLGRPARGWFVVSPSCSTPAVLSENTSSTTSVSLALTAVGGDLRAHLYVF